MKVDILRNADGSLRLFKVGPRDVWSDLAEPSDAVVTVLAKVRSEDNDSEPPYQLVAVQVSRESLELGGFREAEFERQALRLALSAPISH